MLHRPRSMRSCPISFTVSWEETKEKKSGHGTRLLRVGRARAGGGGGVEGGSRLEGLLGFGGEDLLPMNWGEIVPLSFFSQTNSSHSLGGSRGGKPLRVVVLSFPTRRYNHSVDLMDSLLSLGVKKTNLWKKTVCKETHQKKTWKNRVWRKIV